MGLTAWVAGSVWADAVSSWLAAVTTWTAGTAWAGPGGGDAVAAQQAFSISTTVNNIASAIKYAPYDDGTYGAYTFDTNYDTGDITYTPADGRFTFDVGGVFMVDVSTVISTPVTSGNDQELNITGVSVWAPATNMTMNAVVSPSLVPVSLILDTSAADYLEYFIDAIGVGTFNTIDGSSVTLTEVPDITGSPDVHVACISCNDSSNVISSPLFPFRETNYPGTGTFTTHSLNGIEWTPGDGRLTIKRAATYLIDIVLIDVIGTVSNAVYALKFKKNGLTIWQPGDLRHHHATDPFPRPITIQLTLEVDDYLEIEVDSVDVNTTGTKPGTSWSVMEMAA